MAFSGTKKKTGKKRQNQNKLVTGVAVIALVAGAVYGINTIINKPTSQGEDVVARINGEAIYRSEVEQRFTLLDKEKNQKLPYKALNQEQKQRVIKEYAAQKLLAEQAKKQKLDQSVEVQAKVDELLKNAMIKNIIQETLTGEQIKSRYETMVSNVADKEQFDASHIVVPTEEEANDIAKKLKNEKATFEELAKKYSTEKETATNGGRLNTFLSGSLDPDFEMVVGSLKEGEISGPVQTKFGWHIIRLDKRQPAQVAAFDEVKDKVAQQLSNEVVQDYVKELMKDVNIEVVNDSEEDKS